MATGLFRANVKESGGPCQGTVINHLLWKGAQADLSVYADDTGVLRSISIGATNVSTAEGIHVGSTFAKVKAAYGARLTAAHNDGQQPVGLVREGDTWTVFGFDANPLQTLKDTSKVTVIDLSRGSTAAISYGDAC